VPGRRGVSPGDRSEGNPGRRRPFAGVPGHRGCPDKAPTCGKHGTTIDFVATPAEAAELAKKEGKLVFVLHISGIFEDPKFT